MKTSQRRVLSLAAAVTALLLTTNAFAAREPVDLSDSDGNGVISADEIREAHDVRRAAMLEQFDTNGDGQLSRAERGAARDARDAELLALYDQDGNGELSHAERGAAQDDRRTAIEAQLDVNADGELSEAERAGMEAVRAEQGKRGDHRKAGHGGMSGSDRNG